MPHTTTTRSPPPTPVGCTEPRVNTKWPAGSGQQFPFYTASYGDCCLRCQAAAGCKGLSYFKNTLVPSASSCYLYKPAG